MQLDYSLALPNSSGRLLKKFILAAGVKPRALKRG
jgi:hypothetical protein